MLIAASPLSHDEFERRVLAQQLMLLSAPSRNAVIGTPLWAAVVAWLFSGAFPVLGVASPIAALMWLCAVAAASAAAFAIDRAYRRAAMSEAFDPKPWSLALTSSFVCMSATWASSVWVFWFDGNMTNQLTLAVLVICGITNGIILRMHKFEVFLASSGVAALVLWSRFLIEPSDVAGICSVLLPLWFVTMTFYVRTASAHVRRNIEAQVENEILASSVATARDEAEAGRRAAEHANHLKNSFLANMSHELRTPLNAILGFSEVIAHNALGDAPDRYRTYAQDIHGSGQHLLSLINDILDVAKIEAGKMEIDGQWLDGATELGETIKLVRDKASAKNIALQYRCDPGARAYADARAFKQILLNLLSNAVKFTSVGQVTVSLSNVGGAAILVVEDTGCGISRAEIARVFNAFEQTDNRYAQAQGGTGLGLTLVRALTALHGGSCTIESEEGKGTRVEVRLPFPETELGHPESTLSRAA